MASSRTSHKRRIACTLAEGFAALTTLPLPDAPPLAQCPMCRKAPTPAQRHLLTCSRAFARQKMVGQRISVRCRSLLGGGWEGADAEAEDAAVHSAPQQPRVEAAPAAATAQTAHEEERLFGSLRKVTDKRTAGLFLFVEYDEGGEEWLNLAQPGLDARLEGARIVVSPVAFASPRAGERGGANAVHPGGAGGKKRVRGGVQTADGTSGEVDTAAPGSSRRSTRASTRGRAKRARIAPRPAPSAPLGVSLWNNSGVESGDADCGRCANCVDITRPQPCVRNGGSCTGATRVEDCTQCANCADMPRFGGPNVRRQKCVLNGGRRAPWDRVLLGARAAVPLSHALFRAPSLSRLSGVIPDAASEGEFILFTFFSFLPWTSCESFSHLTCSPDHI